MNYLKKISKLKKSIIAMLLILAMLTSTFSNSITVLASQQDEDSTAIEAEAVQETLKSKTTFSVGEGKGSIKIKSTTGDECLIQDTDTDPLVLEYETGTVIEVEITSGEGYEVSTYKVTKDSGATVSSETFTSSSSETRTLTVGEEAVTVSVTFSEVVVETEQEVVAESVTEPVEPPTESGVEAEGVDSEQESEETTATKETSEESTSDGSIWGLFGSQYANTIGRDFIGKYIGSGRTYDVFGRFTRSAAGSAAVITPGSTVNYFGWSTNWFDVSTETGSWVGWCAEPAYPTPSGTFVIAELNDYIIKWIMAFSPGGPYYENTTYSPFSVEGFSYDQRYAMAHAAIGYRYNGSTTGLSATAITYLEKAINQLAWIASGSSDVPQSVIDDINNNYTAYIAYNGNQQDVVWMEYAPTGGLEIYKSSSNTSITDNNSCYSLEGAVYTVYNESGTAVGTITTNFNGYGILNDLPAGNYTVKETTAPNGYLLDDTTYTVTVGANASTRLDVVDNPGMDPVSFAIQKKDAETGSSSTQGNGSYAGAQFTIKYYDGYYTESQLSSLNPTRTWVIQTNASGLTWLSDTNKVSGDDWYYDSTGSPSLPLGTISVEETKAPNGYLLPINTLLSVQQISLDSGLHGVIVLNDVEVSEQVIRGGVTLTKWDLETDSKNAQGDADLSAKIEIRNKSTNSVLVDGTEVVPGTVIATVTTDAYGTWTSSVDWLPYGEYSYREISAPTGYLLSGQLEGTFSIRENGVIVNLNNSDKAIKDQVIRGGVKIAKWDLENDSRNAQGDAELIAEIEFTNKSVNSVVVDGTVYAPGEVIDTITTDEYGIWTSSNNWLPYGTYGYKEVSAPTGYLLSGQIEGTFTIREDGVIVSLDNSNKAIKDQVIKQAFELIKISTDGSTGEVELLENAGFSIYLISDLSAVKDGALTPSNGSTWTAADFASYDFSNETTAIDYSSNSAGTTIPELFTDSKGYLLSPELAYGSYVIVETTTPADTLTIQPFLVTVSEDSRTPQTWRVFNDAPLQAYLKIVKTDATTGETVLKAGAQYRIYNIDTEKYVEQWATYPKTMLVGTEENPFETNDEGYLLTIKALDAGNYRIEEVAAPDGYVKQGYEGILSDEYQAGNTDYDLTPSDPVVISINSNSAIQVEPGSNINTVIVKQKNMPQYGKLNLYKYGDKLSGKTDSEFIYDSVGIEGATFEIYAADTIYTQDNQGTVLYAKDDVVTAITTDTDGHAYANSLSIGKYYIKETVAGEGFTLNTKLIYFEIKSQDDTIAFHFVDKEIENQRQTVTINVEKRQEGTEELLEGAVFGLYATDPILDYQGNVVFEADTLIKQMTTDASGTVTFTNLPIANYYIKELVSPSGFISNDNVYEIETSYTDQTLDVIEEIVIVYNVVTKVEISKIDLTTGEELPGATLQIKDKEGNVVKEWVTTDEPFYFEKLPVGEYTLVEVSTPDGYVTAEEIKFEVLDTGEIQHVLMEDDITKVEISKKDITNEKELPGATLQIKDSEGKVVEEWITTDKPHIFEKLPVGEYILVEINAPDGYVTAQEAHFEVKDNAEIQHVEMTDDVTKVEISKKDITNEKELPGAHLKIVDENGNVVEEWISTDEPHYIEKLPTGKYTLIEVAAPNGYQVAENIEFEVLDTGEIQHVTMYDSPIGKITGNYDTSGLSTPKTGDSTFALILFGLLIASLTVAIVIIFRKRKVEIRKQR